MIKVFPGPDALAAALAETIAAAISRRLAKDGAAAIAVSGGTTPVRFFQALSAKALNWSAVTITLVDERWVAADSGRSNAGLVQRDLLQGPAAAATFISLADVTTTPEQGKAGIEASIRALNLPFAAVTLGMGNDGHTASFFPGGDRLAEALNPSGGQMVETMHAVGAGEPRVTLTLPLLLAADTIAIQIEGAAKRAALDAAMQPGSVTDMPIRAVLAARPAPDIYWCP
jgi:6-phosphogluconolactonase